MHQNHLLYLLLNYGKFSHYSIVPKTELNHCETLLTRNHSPTSETSPRRCSDGNANASATYAPSCTTSTTLKAENIHITTCSKQQPHLTLTKLSKTLSKRPKTKTKRIRNTSAQNLMNLTSNPPQL